MGTLLAGWYQIPNYTEKRTACHAIGCIMPGAVTDGSRFLCVHHAAAITPQDAILLRPMHAPCHHHHDGVCVLCGGQEWYFALGMHQCATCWPKDAYSRVIAPLMDIKSLPVYQGMVPAPLPVVVPEGKAIGQRWADDYLKWRNGENVKATPKLTRRKGASEEIAALL